jgi:hypothetical protein
MGCKSKSFSLLIILIIAVSSIIIVKTACAQSIPTPSVPEFSLKYVDNSYEVPPTSPTYTTDPYTGKQKLVNSGYPSYHVDNRTIELWIKNQPYTNSVGLTTYHIYYDVRLKGHFEQNWFENKGNAVVLELASMPFTFNSTVTTSEYISNSVPLATSSNYTVLSFNGNLDVGAQEDFQVKALIGHDSKFWSAPKSWFFEVHGDYEPAIAFDNESDWSPTQTFTAPTPTPNGSFYGLNSTALTAIISVVVIIATVSAGLLVYFKKRRHKKV